MILKPPQKPCAYGWELRHRKGCVTGAMVREKVLQSRSHYVGCGRDEKASLYASKVWFTKVEKSMSVHSMKRTGDLLNI